MKVIKSTRPPWKGLECGPLSDLRGKHQQDTLSARATTIIKSTGYDGYAIIQAMKAYHQQRKALIACAFDGLGKASDTLQSGGAAVRSLVETRCQAPDPDRGMTKRQASRGPESPPPYGFCCLNLDRFAPGPYFGLTAFTQNLEALFSHPSEEVVVIGISDSSIARCVRTFVIAQGLR